MRVRACVRAFDRVTVCACVRVYKQQACRPTLKKNVSIYSHPIPPPQKERENEKNLIKLEL